MVHITVILDARTTSIMIAVDPIRLCVSPSDSRESGMLATFPQCISKHFND